MITENYNNACGACASAAYSNCTGCDGNCGCKDKERERQRIGREEVIEDVESGEFDNFLTARSRERAKYRKELLKAGKTKDEARELAFEKYPKQTIKETIANIKGNLSNIRTKDQDIDETSSTQTDDLDSSTTVQKETNTTSTNTNKSTSEQNKAGVMNEEKNWKPYLIWGSVGVVVIVGGIFAYRHFTKK